MKNYQRPDGPLWKFYKVVRAASPRAARDRIVLQGKITRQLTRPLSRVYGAGVCNRLDYVGPISGALSNNGRTNEQSDRHFVIYVRNAVL